MENKVETEQQKQHKSGHSFIIWLPFTIVFLLALAMLVFNFSASIKWYDKPFFAIDANLMMNHTIQLITLGVLLAISLLLPFWLYAQRHCEEKYNYPLGLPKGSIRALIVLMAAVTYIVLSIRRDTFEDARDIFIFLVVLYFFARNSESSLDTQAAPQKNKEKEGEVGLTEQKTAILTPRQ
jgi:flagellar basal body-associated protein FliL